MTINQERSFFDKIDCYEYNDINFIVLFSYAQKNSHFGNH